MHTLSSTSSKNTIPFPTQINQSPPEDSVTKCYTRQLVAQHRPTVEKHNNFNSHVLCDAGLVVPLIPHAENFGG